MPDLSDGTWSEIDANNNAAPPNGWPEGMMPSTVNDAARADRGALKRFWDRVNPVQTITPSGGLWTFTTGNVAYPTAYIPGELYCFYPGSSSVGGDQFQVNSLGAKPIWKHEYPGAGGWMPIIAFDIRVGHAAQLVYDPNLNAGSGAFALLNPVLPLQNDGTGYGVNVAGLTVYNPAAPSNFIVQSDGGFRATTRYVGLGSPSAHIWGVGLEPTQGNFVVNDATTNNIRLQIDTAGNATFNSTVTVGAPSAPSGGMLVGDINAQRVLCQGQVLADGTGSSNITGNLNVSGNITTPENVSALGLLLTGSANIPGTLYVYNVQSTGEITTPDLHCTGNAGIDGALNVAGTATFGTITAVNETISGHFSVTGNADITGNVSSGGTVSGQSLYSAGNTSTATLSVSGNANTGNLTVNGLTTTHGILPDHDNTSSSGLSGQAWAQVATYWLNNVSDARQKTDIRQPDAGALAQVMLIKPAEFHWRDKETSDMPLHRGFLAGDVRQVMGERFAGYSKENDVEGLAYHELTAVLWQAVQELAAEVKELRQQIDR